MSSDKIDDSKAFVKEVIKSYKPPGTQCGSIKSTHHPQHLLAPCADIEWVRNHDGSILLDHKDIPVSVGRLLATKPLRHELSSRPGPGNKKLTYLSGEGVTRTLNDVFGFDGWNLEIISTTREHFQETDGRFSVAYTARVRLTHRKSGTYKEDCGAGDAVDRTAGTAIANALKASVTDAMKRAARHFGDKLGNSLYQGTFSINKAPNTLPQALDQYAIDRANTKFGVPTNQAWPTSSQRCSKADELATSPPTSNTEHVKQRTLLQRAEIPNVNEMPAIIPFPTGQLLRKSINITVMPAPKDLSAASDVQAKSTSVLTPVHPTHSNPTSSLQPTPTFGIPSLPIVTPGIMQPPQTPGQRHQESKLVGTSTLQGPMPGKCDFENQPPSNKNEMKRPGTSNGLHQQLKQQVFSGAGPFAGKKRAAEDNRSDEVELFKRSSSVPMQRVSNPYVS